MLKQLRSNRLMLTPAQIIVLGFTLVILGGAAVLSLPVALKSGNFNNAVDALFTATTAVCVTGLVVVDIGSFYNSFGQVVILFLIQIGGLGIITATTFYALLLGKRIGLRERLVLKEALNKDSLGGVVRLVRSILLVTLLTEGMGAVLLFIAFLNYFPPKKALWYSVFHSVSAFCNAGLDLFGQDFTPFCSLIPFQENKLVLLTVAALIVLGGLGFTVILDIFKKKRFDRLTLHSKLAIVVTAALISLGVVVFFFTEAGTSWSGMGITDRLVNSLFLSITPRTAGYTSVDIARTIPATLLLIMFLMFVGASPGGTGGGIKTTTFAILFLAAKSRILSPGDLVVYRRRIEQDNIIRALAVTVLAAGVVFVCILILSLIDSHDIVKLMFEAISAFGTVGLSTGITPDLTVGAKLVIIFLMFFGRLGPLTLAFALLERSTRKNKIIFPHDNVIIG